MDNVMDEKQINNNDSLFAGTIYTMEKIKERGSSLSDRSQEVENMPQEVIDYLKAIENLIQEMEDDGEKLPDCLPRNIKREYQKFEAKERQKEILYKGSLLLLVTYFESLIASVLRESFVKHPQRISLDEKSVSYKVLTELNNIEEIRNILIDQEVTNKMYGSLCDWKKYFQKIIKIDLKAWEDEFETIQEIFARRNLYVHNNGIINTIYMNVVKNTKKDLVGKDLNIDREYIDNAIDIIEYVGMSLVIEIWIKEYGDNQDEIDNMMSIIYEEYLDVQRWKMARHFYEICLKSPKLLDADRILCKINSWLCYKWLGEYDKVKMEVEGIDTSAYKPRYILGVLVLKEDYSKFFEFYDQQTDIGETELKEWPLFIELRKSEEFLKRFPEVEIK